MTEQAPARRGFFSKNIGPVERMLWALAGLALMAVGFEVFNALTETGIGLVFVFIGFLVFLQAPMAWSLWNAIAGRSTFERDAEFEQG
ncbi:MAG: DUF2892 domain-containing protein [Armatimonadetes bacterium]|nr:DUF2892 domain-containing protein [Armatimonadota bacterium]